MRHILLSLSLAIPSATLVGQNPGQKINLDIQLASVNTAADTSGVSYVITNLSSSVEPMWRYFVDAPSGVLRIASPSGTFKWRSDTSFRGQSMARWILTAYLAGGSVTPELHFESVGVPGIVIYWAGGHFQLPSREDELEPDTAALPDPLGAAMITGKTVGVEAWPADRSAQALLARLRSLTLQTCATPLLWITDSTLCTQLVSDVDQAESYRSGGQIASAKSSLEHYRSLLLSGNTAGTVKSSSYWLLKSNSEILDRVM